MVAPNRSSCIKQTLVGCLKARDTSSCSVCDEDKGYYMTTKGWCVKKN